MRAGGKAAFRLAALQARLRERLCLGATAAQIHDAAPSLPRWHCSIRGQDGAGHRVRCRAPSPRHYSSTLGSEGGQEGSAPAARQSCPGLRSQGSLMHICTYRSWGAPALYQVLHGYGAGGGRKAQALFAKELPRTASHPSGHQQTQLRKHQD